MNRLQQYCQHCGYEPHWFPEVYTTTGTDIARGPACAWCGQRSTEITDIVCHVAGCEFKKLGTERRLLERCLKREVGPC